MDIRKYEEIKRDILNMIDKISTIEGSFADATVSPASMELEKAYVLLNNIYLNMFLKNLNTEDLEEKASEYGVFRKNGTIAEGQVSIMALKDTVVAKDTLVASMSKLNYATTEELIFTEDTTMNVNIVAENVGNKYNAKINTITNLPISINGVVSVTNAKEITGGTNVETDESLLERLLEYKKTPATSGNIHHYRNWAREVPGVGDAKVIPLWAGNGTVKVIIVDSNNSPTTEKLVTNVADYIEINRPIGATVTVVSAIAKDINVRAKVELVDGYRIQLVQSEFKIALEEYRKKSGFKDSYISYAAVNNVLFNVPGVLDSNNLTLNEEMKNIALGNEEIAIFKKVELEVM